MEEAKKQRKTAKRLFTFSVNSFDTILDEKASPTISQIEKAVEKMELNYDNLVTANESVLAALPDDCTEEELQVNMSYMKDADSVRADITIAVTNLKLTVSKVEKAQEEEEKNQTPPRPHPVSDMQMKCQLERLKIQHFSGNIRDYPGWKISFQFAMRKYCQDEEEQLQRLKEAVLPPVRKDSIHCQSIVSAFEILDQNYGNSDELMTLFLRDIKSCKPLRNGDAKSLKVFASEIRSFITRMRDLNKKHDLKSDYIVVDLIDKLTPEDQYKFKSYCRDKDLPKYLETLVYWLGDEAQLRSSVFDDTRKSYKVSGSNSVTFKPPQKFKAISQPCLLKCDASHTLKDCPAFYVLKVADRWEIIKDNRCCFCCLRPYHHTRNCFEKKKCTKSGCEKNHHPLLHEDYNRSTQANSSSSSINSAGCGHLPVVKVHVQDDYGVTHEAIAMIDSGSQQSLIRKSFANKLRLRGSQPQDIHIRLAGGCEMVEKSKIYALKISDVNNSQVYELIASSLETVCGDIPPIDNHNLSLYPHLSGLLDLIYCDGGKVDLLIGTNFPTAFKDLGSCCISDENAPIAKQTPLGWVLLGELGQQSEVPYINHVTIMDTPNIAKMFEIDSLGVKPTKACTCRESELAESAFIEKYQVFA